MWAWYHVVPSWAEYQNTVPNAKKRVAANRTAAPDRQPAEHPPRQPDVDRAEDREDQLAVRRAAPQGHERQQDDRRQRRERDVAARHAVGRGHRPDVVEAGVAASTGPSTRPGSGSRSGPRGTPRPATRSGRRCGTGWVEVYTSRADQHEAQSDRDRRDLPSAGNRRAAPERPVGAVRIGWLRATLCYPAIHLSTLVQEAISVLTARASAGPSRGADAPTRTTWTREGVVAILAVLGLALAARLIIAYAFPGTGLEVRSRLVPCLGGEPRAATACTASTTATSSSTTRPGYLYVLYAGRAVGQAIGGIGDLIKIPPILADVAIGWLVWSMALELGASRRAALIGAASSSSPTRSRWFDSVTWGQVDSFGVVFLLLGLRELWRDRPERAAVWAVIAALIKPQLAILVPIVAVVTIRRALWPVDARAMPPTRTRRRRRGALEPLCARGSAAPASRSGSSRPASPA